MIIFGVLAAILSILSFVAEIKFYSDDDKIAARNAGIECVLWFIAMCICFK
jgi:hypothetical protein